MGIAFMASNLSNALAGAIGAMPVRGVGFLCFVVGTAAGRAKLSATAAGVVSFAGAPLVAEQRTINPQPEEFMPATKLKRFLDSRGIKYVTIRHSPAYTAPEVAASAHIAGRDFAKTVIVKIDGAPAMIVLPANRRVVLSDLREMLAIDDVKLATEDEFRDLFPDCELGAMPPFGPLYRLPVYVAQSLADEDEIAFNAGTHSEVIKMAYSDFDHLVKPVVLDFVTT
jgi:Ala-tRNA(Pro) deacylase